MKAKIKKYMMDWAAQWPREDDTGAFMRAADVERVVSDLEYRVSTLAALLDYLARPGAVLDDTMRAHIRGNIRFEEVDNIGAAAQLLIARADAAGLVLRIALAPLAMGRYKMVASVQGQRRLV